MFSCHRIFAFVYLVFPLIARPGTASGQNTSRSTTPSLNSQRNMPSTSSTSIPPYQSTAANGGLTPRSSALQASAAAVLSNNDRAHSSLYPSSHPPSSSAASAPSPYDLPSAPLVIRRPGSSSGVSHQVVAGGGLAAAHALRTTAAVQNVPVVAKPIPNITEHKREKEKDDVVFVIRQNANSTNPNVMSSTQPISTQIPSSPGRKTYNFSPHGGVATMNGNVPSLPVQQPISHPSNASYSFPLRQSAGGSAAAIQATMGSHPYGGINMPISSPTIRQPNATTSPAQTVYSIQPKRG